MLRILVALGMGGLAACASPDPAPLVRDPPPAVKPPGTELPRSLADEREACDPTSPVCPSGTTCRIGVTTERSADTETLAQAAWLCLPTGEASVAVGDACAFGTVAERDAQRLIGSNCAEGLHCVGEEPVCRVPCSPDDPCAVEPGPRGEICAPYALTWPGQDPTDDVTRASGLPLQVCLNADDCDLFGDDCPADHVCHPVVGGQDDLLATCLEQTEQRTAFQACDPGTATCTSGHVCADSGVCQPMCEQGANECDDQCIPFDIEGEASLTTVPGFCGQPLWSFDQSLLPFPGPAEITGEFIYDPLAKGPCRPLVSATITLGGETFAQAPDEVRTWTLDEFVGGASCPVPSARFNPGATGALLGLDLRADPTLALAYADETTFPLDGFAFENATFIPSYTDGSTVSTVVTMRPPTPPSRLPAIEVPFVRTSAQP